MLTVFLLPNTQDYIEYKKDQRIGSCIFIIFLRKKKYDADDKGKASQIENKNN
jgi:hypothetical protein